VLRDKQFEHLSTGPERARRLAAKTRHNLVTMALHLLVDYFLIVGVLLVAWRPINWAGSSNFLATVTATALDVLVALSVFVLAERAVTGFRALKPRYCSIYQLEFWRHERFWKVAPTSYVHLLDGTPFKPLLWRALGVPIGRRVLDDGLAITERTLVRIGDEATFNIGTSLQSHTLEDGTFKSDFITVGNRCTVGIGALVNYDVTIEDDGVLAPDSFLMKGSRMPAGSEWGGNPAAETGRPLLPPLLSSHIDKGRENHGRL
jgi:non-ribosomal peptide synthetase-like protein